MCPALCDPPQCAHPSVTLLGVPLPSVTLPGVTSPCAQPGVTLSGVPSLLCPPWCPLPGVSTLVCPPWCAPPRCHHHPWCPLPVSPHPGVTCGALQAQLRRCLAKQAEVLLQGKRQTAGSLHSLQCQLQVLDDLVSSPATDSLFLPSSPSLGSLHSTLNVTKAQVRFCWAPQF